MMKKNLFSAARILAALIAAVILLASSGFAFADLIRGPAAVTEGGQLSEGAYVTADISFLMDICGAERKQDSAEAVAYFAIAPIGDKFVVLRFPADKYDNIAELESQTRSYLRGELSSPDFRLAVTGTSVSAPEEVSQLLAQWFADNGTWMSQSGLIAAVEDYNTYLCGQMIDTTLVGSVGNTAAAVLTILALILLLYAAAEIVILCVRAARKTGGRDA